MTADPGHFGISDRCRGLATGTTEPCLMVIFGVNGDLSRRSLIPSIVELAARDLLPSRFAIVGFGRKESDDDALRRRLREAAEAGCDELDEDLWSRIEQHLYYHRGDFSQARDFAALAERIDGLRAELDLPDNVFFHLAAPPAFFTTIAANLHQAGLAASESGWRRLVVEKPFGRDRQSAAELNRELEGLFDEAQIYRIDHFLGKETVQNMLVFRFANPGFEPVWNRDYVDHVQITAAEDLGIGTRASFFESTGVVRDMVQNHLLQLLCMTAMEPPARYDGQSLRDQTVQVLRAIAPPQPRHCVRGQYGSGQVAGEPVSAYREEKGVDPASKTATFAALRLEVDSWRWAGVPFYLRTGKRLARKQTEVAIVFKPTPHQMFPVPEHGARESNVLVFRLQPDEGILRTFVAKQPGPGICLTPVTSRFCYADAFGVDALPRAYAWLIHDVMQGDQTLFARADWIDQAWSIVDPVVERWQEEPAEVLPTYAAGTSGPDAAAELLAVDGRRWRRLERPGEAR
jgi:glucose-6-phosphate 1-dehydrogenase